ncbi:hypothetical protein AAY473_040311 [Plecturocebus cupreus]
MVKAHCSLSLPGSSDPVPQPPRVERSDMIIAHCSLKLLSNPPTSAPKDRGLTMLPRQVLKSWVKAILLPWPLNVPGLQA